MSGSQDEIPPPPPPPSSQTPTQQTPHTVSTIKLPILKKGEYDIWAMKMEHYLAHTDYPIWEVIQNGNGPVSITTDTQGQIKVLPPRTAEEILARERERKARTTLLMALPEDHLAKFHKMTDAKEMWDAIKSRFGGNDESKKMQKYILKQQFEGFSVSNSEGLHKGYDRFQSLLSQLEIHGAGVDSLSFDDLYNNLRVFESDVKGSTTSSFSTQNVAFVSENTSSTNDVSTAYGVSNSSGQKLTCRTKGNQDVGEEMLGTSAIMNGEDCSGSDTETQPSESETQTSEFDTCESNISTETPELVSEPVVNESNVACQPKVWSDAPIIEEYESDSEDESLNHLIRDCDLHEKMMAKQAELNNRASGTKNVSTARHSFNRQAVLTSAAMKVNTVKPIVNRVRPTTIFHKTHSPFSRPFNKTTTLRTNFSKQKVNTAKVNAVSAVGGKRETAVKPSAIRDHKDTTGTMSPNTMVDPVLEIDYPHRALQNKGIVDSGCSRHMTGNKAYLAEYQDFNGGPVAFGGSKGYITGKGKQHKASCKAKSVSSISQPLQLLHMDLFGPTSVRSAKASSTNIVNTISTPVSTASPYGGLSFTDPTNPDQDDSEIPVLEDIYQHLTDGIFTNSSYDDEGAVADFTNLETLVNNDFDALKMKVWLIPRQDEICCSSMIQKVWILVNLPYGKMAIWKQNGFIRNKRIERGVCSAEIKQVPSFMEKLMKRSMCLNHPGFIDPKYTQKEVSKDEEASDVESSFIRSMIGHFKEPHYKDAPNSDSDYVGANLDRNPQLGVVNFLAGDLILWQCQKHTIVATSTIEQNISIFNPSVKNFKKFIGFQESLRRDTDVSPSINALTVSPVVSTTFVEQFWTSAKSKIINNVRHITAKVVGKLVSISEASIRSELLFNDADGIDSLPNHAIFDDIQLMGYERDLTVLTFNKALFSPQ
ncbi:hypothetical protein Tco_0809119 [Tanacetum coccineum]